MVIVYLPMEYESSFSRSFLLFQKGIMPTYVVISYVMYLTTPARACHPAGVPAMPDNSCDGNNHGYNKVSTGGIWGLG